MLNKIVGCIMDFVSSPKHIHHHHLHHHLDHGTFYFVSNVFSTFNGYENGTKEGNLVGG